jgi:predicted DNA-binding transcriptional regulator YafY
MSRKLAYERYYWFHGQIKAGHYPNARKLSEEFEISKKQAQREIEFMRDRLSAPLAYDPAKKGYELEDARYELPPVWFNQAEILALCLALRLASTLPDHKLKSSLYDLLEKFLTFRLLDSPPTLTDIKEKVSVKVRGERGSPVAPTTEGRDQARNREDGKGI